MRLLAGLLVGSGVVWTVGLGLAAPVPLSLPLVVVIACYLAVAAVVVLTARRTPRLPGRLAALWALAVVVLLVVLSPLGTGWPLLLGALTYGSVGFLLWAVPALVVFSVVRTVVLPRRA